jgi:hypothetical protein
MDKEKKNLYGFGYGLALLIPFFVTMHNIDHGLKWWMVISLFVLLLFIVTRMVSMKSIWNIWAVVLQVCVFAFGIKQGFSNLSFVFLGLSILVLWVTFIKVEWLQPVYNQFIKVAHFIGKVITGLLLSIMFYCVFGIVGIVLRILGKDLLNRKVDHAASSHWISKDQIDFDKSHYTRQF